MSDAHARLPAQNLSPSHTPAGRLPTDWVADQEWRRLDRTEGDIDALMTRIAQVRQPGLHHPSVFGGGRRLAGARAAPRDRLSDALARPHHPALRRSPRGFLVRQLAAPGPAGSGEPRRRGAGGGPLFGKLDGFRSAPTPRQRTMPRAPLLAPPIACWAARSPSAPGPRGGAPRRVRAHAGRLFALAPRAPSHAHAGDRVLQPRIDVLPAEFLDGSASASRCAAAWRSSLARRSAAACAPLIRLHERSSRRLRGLAYQPWSAGGLAGDPGAGPGDGPRPARCGGASRLGVRLGVEMVTWRRSSIPAPPIIAGLLWSVYHGTVPRRQLARLGAAPGTRRSRTGLRRDGLSRGGARVLRLDRVERLAAALRRLSRQGPLRGASRSWCSSPAAPSRSSRRAVGAGLSRRGGRGGLAFRAERRRRAAPRPPVPVTAEGPFAKLGSLRLAR